MSDPSNREPLDAFVDGLSAEAPSAKGFAFGDEDSNKKQTTFNRRRSRGHWTPIAVFATISMLAGLQFLGSLFSRSLTPTSDMNVSLGIALFSGVIAVLVYTKHLQDRNDAEGEASAVRDEVDRSTQKS